MAMIMPLLFRLRPAKRLQPSVAECRRLLSDNLRHSTIAVKRLQTYFFSSSPSSKHYKWRIREYCVPDCGEQNKEVVTYELIDLREPNPEGKGLRNLHDWTSIANTTKNDRAHRLGFSGRDSSETYMLRHMVPIGYPDTVSAGYARFALYGFVGSVAGSTAMVLSTQTLLLAVGVGTQVAAPMAASLNWILKDGIGQLGGMIFASKILSSRSAITSVDSDPKRWRLISAFSLDAATIMEILSPLYPGKFLLIASVANVLKNIGFITSSASRARIHQSMAQNNNLGDVTAKAGSQSIASSMIGTGLGIILSPLTEGDFTCIMSGVVVLSTVHQYCTYQSLTSVSLNHLNMHRMDCLFSKLFHEHDFSDSQSRVDLLVSSPDNISAHEVFFPFIKPDNSHLWLKVGGSISSIFPYGPSDFHRLMESPIGKEKYIMNCEIHGRLGGPGFNEVCDNHIDLNSVKVSFLQEATNVDVLRGIFHAYTLRAMTQGKKRTSTETSIDDERFNLILESHAFVDKHFDDIFEELSKTGWDVNAEIVVESTAEKRFVIERC